MKQNIKRLYATRRFSRYMRRLGILICLFSTVVLPAQDSVRQKLFYAYQLEQTGRFSQAIAVAKPLMNSSDLSIPDHSRGWILIAMAYQQEGRFEEAHRAYDQSLLLLKNQPQYLRDYAVALSAFATLYQDMGRSDESIHLENQVVSIYKQTNDHRGIAIAFERIAELALAQGDKREGRKNLTEAIREAALADDLDDDFHASTSATQAWLAELDGNPAEAILGYQHALDLWTAIYGNEHPTVGWAFMLLGKAYLKAGDTSNALNEMQKGLAILERSSGRNSIKYLTADLAYARTLDAAGKHDQADQIMASAGEKLNALYQNQCIRCQVSAAALH
jgi:tetratricopeptide (TPR) repeat protein